MDCKSESTSSPLVQNQAGSSQVSSNGDSDSDSSSFGVSISEEASDTLSVTASDNGDQERDPDLSRPGSPTQ